MIEVLRNDKIRNAIAVNGHQYLAGKLSRPQELEYIQDENINVGIGHHHTFDAEKAHYHTTCTEYQFVIKGQAKYVDIGRDREYLVDSGDFFVVRPNTKYVMKAQKDCEILFFKDSTVNDKIEIDECQEAVKLWASSWEISWEECKKNAEVEIE